MVAAPWFGARLLGAVRGVMKGGVFLERASLAHARTPARKLEYI
jgi:hypothetical protein